ncbi:MAG: hypothetical protein HZB09_00445 [Candidatus Yonathbacteria bacterium]|nr:hypothetical protein [Candidatus Yonathbacteria bacterium]
MKKILLSFGALAAVVIAMPMFAAFEAHVVNVTATIENALQVTSNELAYGTVFPQEAFDKTFGVSLSQSFTAEPSVTGVTYTIRQKPKCVDSAGAHPLVTEDAQGNFACPAGSTMMPLLCPYLSKHETAGNIEQSSGINSFHGLPGPWTASTTLATAVFGSLTKETNQSDTWTIDLHVPCFAGSCAQDWAAYVHSQNPDADPSAYMADPRLEHTQFGCDLWLETTGIGTTTPAV